MVWNNGAANTYKYHCRENHSRPTSIDDPVSQANNCIHYYFEDELIGAMQRASKVEAAHIDQIITRAMKNKAQSIVPMCILPEDDTAENADIPPHSARNRIASTNPSDSPVAADPYLLQALALIELWRNIR